MQSSTLYFFKTKENITIFFKDGSSACWEANDPEYERIHNLCLKEGYVPIRILHDPERGDIFAEGYAESKSKPSEEVVNGTSVETGNESIYKDRLEETYQLMKIHGDKKKVAEIMGITVSTVKRNICKYNQRERELAEKAGK